MKKVSLKKMLLTLCIGLGIGISTFANAIDCVGLAYKCENYTYPENAEPCRQLNRWCEGGWPLH